MRLAKWYKMLKKWLFIPLQNKIIYWMFIDSFYIAIATQNSTSSPKNVHLQMNKITLIEYGWKSANLVLNIKIYCYCNALDDTASLWL